MGIFGAIRSSYRKNCAAASLAKLLEPMVDMGMLDGNPAILAGIVVSKFWASAPSIVNGKFGQRPHKLSVIAASLSHTVGAMPESDPDRPVYIIALGNVITEYVTNGSFYVLSDMDHTLMANAIGLYKTQANKIESDYKRILKELNDFRRGTS